MRIHFLLSTFLLVCSGVCAADEPVVRALSLVVGNGNLLQFDHDVSRVVVSEPKIADAVVVSPRDVMVNAKGPGHTTLVIWENEAAPVRYDITVAVDTTELDSLQKSLSAELKSALPDTRIEFSGNADTIVLTGKGANADQLKRRRGTGP